MTTQPNTAQLYEEAFRARERANEIIKKGTQVGDSLSSPDGSIGGQITDVRYPGAIPMWDMETGVMSECLPYMMGNRLNARKPNGRPAFTFTDPGIRKPLVGGFKCYLHPDVEGSAELFQMGFQPCTKQHIPSTAALELHMRKHSQAWATIKEMRVRKEREEALAYQRTTAELMQSLLGQQPAVKEKQPVASVTEKCDVEGCEFEAQGFRLAVSNKMKAHKRAAHGME